MPFLVLFRLIFWFTLRSLNEILPSSPLRDKVFFNNFKKVVYQLLSLERELIYKVKFFYLGGLFFYTP